MSSRKGEASKAKLAPVRAAHCSALPVYDARSADEILDYDENGLFL